MIERLPVLCDGLKGKRILDVGTDLQGNTIKKLSQYQPLEVIGLNLNTGNREICPGCHLESGDIRRTDYPENYFDIVVSYSAFEHIHELSLALKEIYRILKRGGLLYSSFGPVWSACYGHHLWIHYQGQLYNYRNVILPPFCHLLMQPDQLFEYCNNSYGADLSKDIVKFVYESPDQNHLFFEDYKQIIEDSRFDTIICKGYDNPNLNKLYYPFISHRTIESLLIKFPRYKDFLFNGMEILLKK